MNSKNEFNKEPPNNWVYWLSTFKMFDERLIDYEDLNKIRVSISRAYHLKKLAKFTTKLNRELNSVTIKRIR